MLGSYLDLIGGLRCTPKKAESAVPFGDAETTGRPWISGDWVQLAVGLHSFRKLTLPMRIILSYGTIYPKP